MIALKNRTRIARISANHARTGQRRRRDISVANAAPNNLQLRRSDVIPEHAAPTELGVLVLAWFYDDVTLTA